MLPGSVLCRFRGGPLDGQRFPVRGMPLWVSVPMIAAAEPVGPPDAPVSETGPRIITHIYRREPWNDHADGKPVYSYYSTDPR